MIPNRRTWKLAVFASIILSSATLQAAQLIGHWTFENSANLSQATLGSALTLNGTTTATTGVGGDGAIDVATGINSWISVPNSIGANGASGTPTRTNQYTILIDFMVPDFKDGGTDAGQFTGLFDFDGGGTDGDYFIRKQANATELGVSGSWSYVGTGSTIAGDGNGGTVRSGTWYRLVLSSNVGVGRSVYLNGTLVGSHGAGTLDAARQSLTTAFRVLWDNTAAENSRVIISNLALFDGALTASEVTTQGSAGAPIGITNASPIFTQGGTRTLSTLKNSAASSLTFNLTDIENDPITWSISTPPANGSAVIATSSNTACTVNYTPAAGYSGPDSYTLQASDGTNQVTSQAIIYVADPANPTYPTPSGWWQFDAEIEPTLATLGNDLTAVGSGFTFSPGIAAGDGAMEVAVGSHYIVDHGIPAGTGGGTKVNEYSILFDVQIPASGWHALYQANPANTDDAEAFFNASNNLGLGALGGYSTNAAVQGRWYRVVMTVDNGTDRSLYVNGQLWFNGNAGTLDDRHSLASTFLALADDNGEDGAMKISNLAVWSAVLTPTQIIALNGPGAFIVDVTPPIPNNPPIITEGATSSANTGMAVATPLTFHVTDADSDPITWTISSAPANGTAVITASSNSECTVIYTSTNQFIGTDSYTLSASDGTASDAIVVSLNVQNSPPLIAEGESYQLSATKNGGARSATFTASDANTNSLTWSIITPASHGSATISSSTSSACTISYTPVTDYIGPDTYVVQVSDGLATDSVLVNVTVSDPTADPILTIVSPFGTPSPAIGPHQAASGTSFSPSVTNQIGTDTRHTCIGWTMTGDAPHSGSGNSFAMSLTRDSTLTWQWLTEHRIVTATSGNGSINIPTGWHPAGIPLQITATPAAGYHFSGWTGDISGCTLGGKNIVIPMNGPRATITANFSANENFSVVALPDTQNYTSISSPTDTIAQQAQWIVNNKNTLNIKFVTHLGDIVNSPTNSSQWTRATDGMNILNTQLPYGTCPGNHDLGSRDNPGSTTPSDYLIRFGPNPTHTSSVGRWVDPSNSTTYDWYRGSSPRGYSSYQIKKINGRDFMFLHLDHDCPDADMAWAASVLSAHPQTLTMITTHNYLAETGGTGFFGTGTGQRGYTAQPNVSIGPDRNKPQEVFDALVKPFNQVYMVICGHMFAIYNLEKTNDAGNTVHEVVCDYQSLPNGGNGFLRIMEFRPGENKIYNSSFSPTLGRYIDPNLPADRQGMLDLHNPNGGEFVLDTDFETRFDSTLTIASAHSTVSPAVGAHAITTGTPFVVSATDQTVGQTRYKPTGWTLTGAQNTSGTGSSAILTQAGDSTLTWTWATEYFLETATTGDGIVSISSGWQTSGANVTIVAQPDPGATFSNWSGDIVGCIINGASITVPMDRSRGPITAQFSSSVPNYLVQVVSPYASTTPAAATYSYEENSSITFSATDLTEGDTRRVCTGYTVTGDITTSGTANTVTLAITGNATLTWLWKTQHQVSAVAAGPGTVSPTVSWIDEGTQLTITGTPSTGANLVSWTGDTSSGNGSGNTFSIANVNRPMSPITANFALGTHTLTVVSSAGSVTPGVGPLILPHGTVVEFEALPSVTGLTRSVPTGWTLTGDNADSGTTTSGSFVLNSDATLTWSWSGEVYLAISSGFEGKVTPFDAEGWKPLNTQVTLTAAPAAGYQFVKWNGDVPANSTSPSITITMDQSRQITADASPVATTTGIPHWWLDTHAHVINGNYEAAALADSDGDGQSAAAEFTAGTNDLDASRRFQVTQIGPITGANILLSWQSNTLRNYYIRSSPDLTTAFAEIAGPITGQWPNTSTSVPTSGSRHFYQIESRLPAAGSLDADSIALSQQPATGSMLRQMKRIPAGWFTQGDNGGVQDTKPSHQTWVPGFDMDRYEVTRADWEKVATWASTHGYDIPIAQQYIVTANKPAVAISWYNAVKWCNARSEMEGRIPAYHADTAGATIYRTGQIDLTTAHVNWSGNGYRLPTESEWERASRGGIENQPYPWGGGNCDFRANHWNYELYLGVAPSQDFPYLLAVGTFNGTQLGENYDTVNAYGLYDMVGNAWEWTWDRMNTYTADTKINPRGPNTGAFRVQRGGSWWNYVDQATNFQRLAFPPNGTDDYGMNGFRCIRGLHPNE
jgi:uncharacterized repeat protein (TIGR02543 family)